MKRIHNLVGDTWCKLMHPTPMWPINGYYRRPTCLRTHSVPWEHPQGTSRQKARAVVVGPATAEAVLAGSSR